MGSPRGNSGACLFLQAQAALSPSFFTGRGGSLSRPQSARPPRRRAKPAAKDEMKHARRARVPCPARPQSANAAGQSPPPSCGRAHATKHAAGDRPPSICTGRAGLGLCRNHRTGMDEYPAVSGSVDFGRVSVCARAVTRASSQPGSAGACGNARGAESRRGVCFGFRAPRLKKKERAKTRRPERAALRVSRGESNQSCFQRADQAAGSRLAYLSNHSSIISR